MPSHEDIQWFREIPALRRRVLLINVIGAAPALVIGVVVITGALGVKSAWAQMLIVTGIVIAGLVSMRIARQSARVVCRSALARNGAVCLHCLYELPQQPETGTCPECGKPYVLTNNRVAWGAGRS